jgi:flagellar hook-associated protein 3 FlgL
VDFNRSRGIVGARAKAMQDRLTQTEGAVFATQELLSEVQDLDYTEAVTKFQQAQTALQASLLTGSRLANTSLLDFLG